MSRVVTLKINDQEVSGREDETILDVARENGVDIPTLCYLDGLSAVGACRLCLVEVVGVARLLPACVTRVSEGMEVRTHSERLQRYRRMIVELLFSEGNHICSVCVSNGHCELQSMAIKLGLDHIEMPYRFPVRQVDASHARYGLDPNRCILCTRCVRVCDEIEGAHTWDIMGRGIASQLITDMHTPWGESETCTSCGKCVQVCPTGALFVKGKSVAEMTKRPDFLPYLAMMRSRKQDS
ncbi:MAG: bidirectional hydrogenase complex protein HoxU [Candidatus Thermofonsia Clade 1 bacterium]|jgi:bidirectional [NiFe] hydrogenase diaphorase subunit|uniref:Bidirectional hydrogenase complex protein HoxU n=4 Tax=Candidatus Thermofonsia Clade 1 bacterium TaxID=2364210 RepID=A0A2M8Q0C6_9CHLR|nr:MAG: bidirectional hydrogenase complex protein HoxU [Candidatus Thermofonsia Clade 1 bacterium]